jgi:cytoplasmic iron level regulating protein YaaA (DUF328/UPF0246 family)
MRSAGTPPGLERAPTLPAIDRYTGVLFTHLDAGSLPVGAASRLTRDVVLLSGCGACSPPRTGSPPTA